MSPPPPQGFYRGLLWYNSIIFVLCICFTGFLAQQRFNCPVDVYLLLGINIVCTGLITALLMCQSIIQAPYWSVPRRCAVIIFYAISLYITLSQIVQFDVKLANCNDTMPMTITAIALARFVKDAFMAFMVVHTITLLA